MDGMSEHLHDLNVNDFGEFHRLKDEMLDAVSVVTKQEWDRVKRLE